MNKLLLYSRVLQFSILLSFLLPFFFLGCEHKSDESAAAADTTEVAMIDSSHSSLKAANIQDSTTAGDTVLLPQDKHDSTYSEKFCAQHEWLRPVLIPGDYVHTGAAAVMDAGSQVIFMNIFYSFITLIIAMLIKWMDPTAVRTQILINLVALLFIFLYVPSLSFDRLWGFWVCTILFLLTLGVDVYRLALIHAKKLYQS